VCSHHYTHRHTCRGCWSPSSSLPLTLSPSLPRTCSSCEWTKGNVWETGGWIHLRTAVRRCLRRRRPRQRRLLRLLPRNPPFYRKISPIRSGKWKTVYCPPLIAAQIELLGSRGLKRRDKGVKL